MVKQLDSKSFAEAIKNTTHKTVVVDFFADWCGPCKKLAPELEKYSKHYTNIAFYKINVDECEDISSKYKITSLPSLVFFQGGKDIHRIVGFNTQTIQDYLKTIN
jgi:thioredoxin 1